MEKQQICVSPAPSLFLKWPSEGGKHAVHNTQLLISKKCKDSGTRMRITHWKKWHTSTNYSRHPTREGRREKHQQSAEQPQVCGKGDSKPVPPARPQQRPAMEAAGRGAAAAAAGTGQAHRCWGKGPADGKGEPRGEARSSPLAPSPQQRRRHSKLPPPRARRRGGQSAPALG